MRIDPVSVFTGTRTACGTHTTAGTSGSIRAVVMGRCWPNALTIEVTGYSVTPMQGTVRRPPTLHRPRRRSRRDLPSAALGRRTRTTRRRQTPGHRRPRLRRWPEHQNRTRRGDEFAGASPADCGGDGARIVHLGHVPANVIGQLQPRSAKNPSQSTAPSRAIDPSDHDGVSLNPNRPWPLPTADPADVAMRGDDRTAPASMDVVTLVGRYPGIVRVLAAALCEVIQDVPGSPLANVTAGHPHALDVRSVRV